MPGTTGQAFALWGGGVAEEDQPCWTTSIPGSFWTTSIPGRAFDKAAPRHGVSHGYPRTRQQALTLSGASPWSLSRLSQDTPTSPHPQRRLAMESLTTIPRHANKPSQNALTLLTTLTPDRPASFPRPCRRRPQPPAPPELLSYTGTVTRPQYTALNHGTSASAKGRYDYWVKERGRGQAEEKTCARSSCSP